MVSQEDFGKLYDKVKEGKTLTKKEQRLLIDTVLETSSSLDVIQSALHLTLENGKNVVSGLSEAIVQMSGRTQGAFKTKVAKYSGEIAAKFEMATRMFIIEEFERVAAELNGSDSASDVVSDSILTPADVKEKEVTLTEEANEQ